MKNKIFYVIPLVLFVILTMFRNFFNLNDLQYSTGAFLIILLIAILKLIVANNNS